MNELRRQKIKKYYEDWADEKEDAFTRQSEWVGDAVLGFVTYCLKESNTQNNKYISLEEIKRHIGVYYACGVDTNGKVSTPEHKTVRLEDLEWLFNNIEGLREVYPIKENEK